MKCTGTKKLAVRMAAAAGNDFPASAATAASTSPRPRTPAGRRLAVWPLPVRVAFHRVAFVKVDY